MSGQPTGNTAEREWQRWWNSLPEDDRKKITDCERSIGAELSWNQRYVMVAGKRS